MSNYRLNTLASCKWLWPFGIVSLCLSCSCGVTLTGGSSTGEVRDEARPVEHAQKLKIPPGHLPPPGSCRIWVPGVPPGHQSAPGACSELVQRVPPGAWLLRRDRSNPGQIEVLVYHERKPSVVVAIRYFEVSTGRLLSTIDP
jgi:hypothetical protein